MNRDWQDVIGGALMSLIGVAVALYAQRYDMGSLTRMGPGYFPVALGWLLGALGLGIAVPAWRRQGGLPSVQWRTAALVLGCIGFFAVALPVAGLVPAAAGTVLLSTLADRGATLRFRLLLSAFLTLLTLLIFHVGLGMILPLWPSWPQA